MSVSKQVVGLIGWLALAFVAATVGAVASIRATDFYQELLRPSWAPPAGLFGPVWSMLYVLMGISSWLVWREHPSKSRGPLFLYVLQLATNALWSWLFFAWHLGLWAVIEILVLWVLIVATVVSFWRIRGLAGLLMLPYLIWVLFAAILAYSVWQLNPKLLS